MTWLFDADAFICIHRLGFLELVETTPAQLDLTSFVARHELNSLQDVVTRLEMAGCLRVHEVLTRTPEHSTYRSLMRDHGADKGEAEAIAWASHHAPEITFISNDRRARSLAVHLGLSAVDAFDVLIAWVDVGFLTRSDVFVRLAPWEDQRQSFCRPRDFTTLDETWARRGGR